MVSTVEARRLEAARHGDQVRFAELTEPYRSELRAYCYRMLGSLQDAEDAVQETMLRAWRKLDTFEGRASFRAWLYKIATNASLDALDRSRRRTLPQAIAAPADPHADLPAPVLDPIWLDPFPEDWLDETHPSPEAQVSLQESVTLAFMTALQLLPPRQRAVLVLCDVLDWKAQETADLLDMTLSAVNSALHRARVTLSGHDAAPSIQANSDTRSLLDRYLRVWESADIEGLVALLKEDATFTMPPSPAWYQGRDAVAAFFAAQVFAHGPIYRLVPIAVSGRAGFAAYGLDPRTGQFEAHAIHVLELRGGQVLGITGFLTPHLFRTFGLSDTLS